MKRIQITDLHFGNKNNDSRHNQDLLTFFAYLVDWCVERDLDTREVGLDIMGDLFQQRDKLSVVTINRALDGIKFLADNFHDVRLIVGNHDLPYRDSRKDSSLEIFRSIPGVKLVDYYEIDGNCMYVSWLVSDEEYEEIVKVSKAKKIRWMFGHFEFAGFRLNDNFITEHGSSYRALKHLDKVYSGHYHAHQIKDNIEYLGTPFPYDMNDANDLDRGFQLFDTKTGEAERILYEKIMVLSVPPEDLLNNEWEGMGDVTLRVVIEDQIDDETMDAIRSKLESGGFRDTKLVYKVNTKKELLDSESDAAEAFDGEIQSVDKLVVDHIERMTEVEGVDKSLLRQIYLTAKDQE